MPEAPVNFDPPLKDLRNKVAFITGGSSGIGLGIARACFDAGMRVVITYKTPGHLAEARTHFERSIGAFHAIHLDVTDRDAMTRAADETERVFGEVDFLCNNAGIGIHTPISTATYEDWDCALATNVGGVVNGIQTFVPRMLDWGKPAHIVSTASMSGLLHGGIAGIYTTTKFAVVGMMEALRAELMPYRIGVSVLCPGLVQSKIFMHTRNRSSLPPSPDSEESLAARRVEAVIAKGMSAYECGQRVLRGVQRNEMYILTHPEYESGLTERWEALKAAIPRGEHVPPERIRAEHRVLRHPVYSPENLPSRAGT